MDNIMDENQPIMKPTFFKRPRTYVWAGIIVLVLAGGAFLFRAKPSTLKTVAVQKGNIEQVISETGQISANDQVNLSFDHSGKVVSISGAVGDKVTAGQVLAKLDSSDLEAQLLGATANVQSAQAKYDQLLQGPRPEDVSVLQTSLDSAKNILNDTLTKDSLAVAKTALNTAINAMVSVSDSAQKYPNIDFDQFQKIIGDKADALFAIYDKPNLGNYNSSAFLVLQSGLVAEISGYETNPSLVDGNQLIKDVKNVLVLTQTALDDIYTGLNGITATDADKAVIVSAKAGVLAQITAVTDQGQAIITAQNNVASLESQLALKIAPPTQYDIDIAKAALTQAQASQAQIQSQLDKNTLRSPIAGTIATFDLQVGEIVAPEATVVSVIGMNKYQIESNVPEADVSKIKVGDPATVTLDAYGPDVTWNAVVSQIYPSESVIEGVPTYKTIFTLSQNDDRIKPGMTANLDISNDNRQNVLFLPQRTIIRENGNKYVQLLSADGVHSTQVQIQTGLYGSDGKVEILSGVREGDKIITD